MRFRHLRQALSCFCIVFLLVQSSVSDTRPLPEDTGALRLYQLLVKLKRRTEQVRRGKL